MEPEAPPARDKLLFTPGPLTTSPTVKQAMLRDAGSRDPGFIDTVRSIRQRLLDIAADKSISTLVGVKTGNITKKPANVEILTRSDLA